MHFLNTVGIYLVVANGDGANIGDAPSEAYFQFKIVVQKILAHSILIKCL